MNKKRIKRKVKQRLSLIIPALVAIFILAVIAVKISTDKPAQEENKSFIEVTTTDIFSPEYRDSIDSRYLSVMGVALGDTQEDIISKLGSPDHSTTPAPNTLNMEYGEKLGMDETGLIIQLINNQARKITVKQPFNIHLVGTTKIEHTKDEIYFTLGKPDEIYIVPESPGSSKAFRLLQYQMKGIEVLIDRNEETGFSITNNFYTPISP